VQNASSRAPVKADVEGRGVQVTYTFDGFWSNWGVKRDWGICACFVLDEVGQKEVQEAQPETIIEQQSTCHEPVKFRELG
jgi:hypothetical protein